MFFRDSYPIISLQTTSKKAQFGHTAQDNIARHRDSSVSCTKGYLYAICVAARTDDDDDADDGSTLRLISGRKKSRDMDFCNLFSVAYRQKCAL